MRWGLVLLGYLFWCAWAWADSQSVAKAQASANAVAPFYNDPAALQKNLTTPLLANGQLTGFDGKQFGGGIGCSVSAKLLSVFAAPGSSGDIASLILSEDVDLDGTVDYVYQPPMPISGVCANGVIACTPGTWNNCQGLAWTANANNQIQLATTGITQLGGCYCINNHCGNGLVMTNLGKVLSDLGGGAIGALHDSNPYYTISKVIASGPSIDFEAQRATDCSTGPTNATNYMNNPASLASDAFSTATVDSNYQLIVNSPAAQEDASTTHQCIVTRTVDIDETTLNEIIDYNSGPGDVTPCGPDCLQLKLGQVGNDYWCSSCGIFQHSVQFTVLKPSRILDATLINAQFDDWMQVRINNNLIWNGPFGTWTGNGLPPASCELSTSWNQNPAADFTAMLKAGGVMNFDIRVAVAGCGEGYAYAKVHVDTACKLKPAYITNGCQAFENDPDCNLQDETVDSVQTFSNFAPTGLTPLPSSHTILGSVCSLTATENWWHKDRTYRCKQSQNYNFDDALHRAEHVQQSVTTTSYEDYLKDSSGNWSPHPGSLSVLNEVPVAACTQVCKTSRITPGNDAASEGVVADQRNAPATPEFFYHECQNNVCPTGLGESVITACGCLNEFAEAATIMQAMRMAGRDTICTSGTKSNL